MSKKSAWVKVDKPGHWLRYETENYSGILDVSFNTIQEWSTENKCGTRMAYDMWQFKNQAEMTVFLLRWS